MPCQERAPARAVVCATSPTMVMDRVGTRRSSMRHAMADSSCASSTTTCPYVGVRAGLRACRLVVLAEQLRGLVEQRDVGGGPRCPGLPMQHRPVPAGELGGG